jgi:competence protein ComEC
VGGLLACLALPIVPALGTLLASVAWLPSAWIAAVATFFAGIPGARLPWPGGVIGAGGLAAVTAGALFVIFAPVPQRWRVGVGAAGMLGVGTMIVCAVAVPGIGVAPAA